MNLSKSTTQAVGLLVLVVILGAAGFFVVKPQVEGAFSLQDQTAAAKSATQVREIRSNTLAKQSQNLPTLKENVNDLLKEIPSAKNVTDIAGAVIEAMPSTVTLQSFSHGDLDAAVPNFKEPEVSLDPLKPPFSLDKKKVSAAPTKTTDGKPAPTPAPTETKPVVPPLAGAPFILTVTANSYDDLLLFIDTMQNQKRLITVVAVTSSTGTDGVTATIYAYAFAGDNPQITKWESPVKSK